MRKILALFILLNHLIAQGQSNTKQVLIEGNGPPVVLLHGGTFDYTAYAAHAKLLAESFCVVRMMQFNVQYADEQLTLPKHYSVQMESDAVKATLDSLNITQPVILVGHSFGGVIAFDFAINYPKSIQALILVEAPLFDIAKVKGEYSDQMKQIDELTKHFTPQATITEEMIKSFRCEMTNCDTFDIRTHPMWNKWLKQKDRLKGLSVVPAYKIDFDKLHAFQKPVLIVTGTTTIEPNKTIDKLLSREFSHTKTANLSGEHIAIYQQPEAFVQRLRVFLQETK
jgi:pimeloyl-ACP methyl ester carboxylesterase